MNYLICMRSNIIADMFLLFSTMLRNAAVVEYNVKRSKDNLFQLRKWWSWNSVSLQIFGRALQIIICSSAVENSQKDTFTWYTGAQLERTGEAGEISLMAYDPEWAMAINIKKTVIQRK